MVRKLKFRFVPFPCRVSFACSLPCIPPLNPRLTSSGVETIQSMCFTCNHYTYQDELCVLPLQGTSSDQDARFADKKKKLMKSMKFGESVEKRVSVFDFLGPNPKGLGPIGLGCPSVRPSVRHTF